MGSPFLVGLGGAGYDPDFAECSQSASSEPTPDAPEPIIITGPDGPPGFAGKKGANGANGLDSFTTTTATFIVPNVGASGTVPVANSAKFAIGQPIFIEGGGYFKITSIPGPSVMGLRNTGAAGNALPNTAVLLGKKVIGAGLPGLPGTPPTGLKTAFLAIVKNSGVEGGRTEARTFGGGRRRNGWGPLTEVYDPYNLVIPAGEAYEINSGQPLPTLQPNILTGFSLERGYYHVRVRQPGFGVGRFIARFKGGATGTFIKDGVPATSIYTQAVAPDGVVQGLPGLTFAQARTNAGYADATNTIQATATGDFYVFGNGPGLIYYLEFICQQATAGNPDNALGIPSNFAGESEIYTTIKIKQVASYP